MSIVPSLDGAGKEIQRQLAGVADTGGGATRAGSSIGDSILGGVGTVLKGGAIALGGLAVAGLGTAMVKGFQRLDALDQAEAKLKGLGHSAQGVDTIMNDALASVKGTAFGMGDAATVAAATVAAGVKPGKELQRTLGLVGDAATIAGVDMSTMGSIVNKVATSDMMQMDVANQLMDAGIPILQMVGDEMGVTAEEARKMASEGEISFETFQNALESGLGGAALESGNTFSGAMDNVMAAFGRVGESLLDGAFENMKGGFGDLTSVLDDLQPVFADIGERVGEFASVAIPALIDGLSATVEWLGDLGGWIRDNSTWIAPLAVAIGAAAAAFVAWHTAISIWSGITKLATGIQTAFNLVMAANPVMLIVMAIAALVAGLVYFFTQTELGQEIWANFTQFLSEAWANITQFLSETWANITQWFTDFGTSVSTIWNDTWSAVGTFLSEAWANIKQFFADALQWVVDMFLNWTVYGLIIKNWDSIVAFFGDTWNNIKNFVKAGIDFVSNVISTVTNTIKSIWNSAWNGIKTFFSDVWNSIVSAASGFMNSVKDKFNTVIDFVKGVPGKIIGFFSNLGSKLLGSGRALIQGFLDGIMAGFNRAKDFVADGLAGIRNLFPFSPAKEGPFSGRGWVAYAGLSLGATFTEAIADSLHDGRKDIHDEIAGIQREFDALDGGFNRGFRLSSATPETFGADVVGGVVQQNEIHMHERDPRLVMRQLGRELQGVLPS